MAEQFQKTMWRSNSGQEFETEKEAVIRDVRDQLERAVDVEFVQNASRADIVDIIFSCRWDIQDCFRTLDNAGITRGSR